jgi:hypothetical protein
MIRAKHLFGLNGLFVNSDAASCSIFETNLDIYNILVKKFNLDYMETTSPKVVEIKTKIKSYDYLIVNYHYTVNPHMIKQNLSNLNIPVIGFYLEILENNINTNLNFFDSLCLPDPTIPQTNKIFPFPRPILDFEPIKEKHEKSIIGYNGFVTPGKPLDSFVNAIKNEFTNDEIIIKLNFPAATYVPNTLKITTSYINQIKSKLPNYEIIATMHYFTKNELLCWIASCDLMMYHYHRNMAGLSATTDQAISAETPISITNCNTFRHLHPYVGYYPQISLKESLEQKEHIKKIKKDWCEDNFRNKFVEVLLKTLNSKII